MGYRHCNVLIKDIDLDPSMTKSIARQAEAERERRAKILYAEGEKQSAQKLVEATDILCESPNALSLRYIQALVQISNSQSNTILMPLPAKIFEKLTTIVDEATDKPVAKPAKPENKNKDSKAK